MICVFLSLNCSYYTTGHLNPTLHCRDTWLGLTRITCKFQNANLWTFSVLWSLRAVNFVKTNSFTGERERSGGKAGRVTSRLRALAEQMTERAESWVRHTREDDGALCRAEQTTAGLLDTSGRVAFVVSLHETSNTAGTEPHPSRQTRPSWSMTANKPNCSSRVNPITVTFSHQIFQPVSFIILTFKNIFSRSL